MVLYTSHCCCNNALPNIGQLIGIIISSRNNVFFSWAFASWIKASTNHVVWNPPGGSAVQTKEANFRTFFNIGERRHGPDPLLFLPFTIKALKRWWNSSQQTRLCKNVPQTDCREDSCDATYSVDYFASIMSRSEIFSLLGAPWKTTLNWYYIQNQTKPTPIERKQTQCHQAYWFCTKAKVPTAKGDWFREVCGCTSTTMCHHFHSLPSLHLCRLQVCELSCNWREWVGRPYVRDP